jgi:hypothetical protein
MAEVRGPAKLISPSDIRNYRLVNQQIAKSKFKHPHEIIGWLGAMQAQEFQMARWAIGLRLNKTTDIDVLKAYNEGKILRTHILRPTWHFVAPEDIRWMLMLSAPRVHAFNAYMYRRYKLDKKLFTRTNDIIVKLLEGKNYKTRTEIKAEFAKAKLKGDTVWLSCIMMYAELEGIICSGPRIGNKFTYALLDERAPKNKTMGRDEALAELTKRYFTSRGPATIQDFVWWSGLTVKDAKTGAAMLGNNFKRITINGVEYIYPKTIIPKNIDEFQTTYLMPDYDEYGISYKNRNVLRNEDIPLGMIKGNSTVYSHWLVLNGVISGTWNRTENNGKISAEVKPFIPLYKKDKLAVEKAVERYNKFFIRK